MSTTYKKAAFRSGVMMVSGAFFLGCYFLYLRHGGEPTKYGLIPLAWFLGGFFYRICHKIKRNRIESEVY